MNARWRRVAPFAGPPGAWAAHLLLSYLLVAPTCGGTTVPLHVTTAVLTVVAAGSLVLGLSALREGRKAAISLGALFVLAIVLQGAANAVVDPCA